MTTATKKRRRKRQPKNPGQSIVSAGLSPQLKAEVHRFAAENGVTVSDVVRDGLALKLFGNAGGEDVVAVLNDDERRRGRVT